MEPSLSSFSRPPTGIHSHDDNMLHLVSHSQTLAHVTGGLKSMYCDIHEGNVPPVTTSKKHTDSSGYFQPERNLVLAKRYRIQSCIESKGQSAVLVKAKDCFHQDMPVVIKVMHNSYLAVGLKEVQMLRRINSADPRNTSHTIKLLNSFMFEEHICLVFPFFNSQPVTKIIKKNALSEAQLMSFIRKISLRLLTALAFLRSQNTIHADVKPDNILLEKEDDLDSVTLIDFGNAIHHTHTEVSLYYTDFELQSLPYRAPEVHLGHPFGVEVDMWSLGCVLLELFRGSIVFNGTDRVDTLKRMTSVLGPVPTDMCKRGKFYSEVESVVLAADHTQKVGSGALRLMSAIPSIRDYEFASFLSGLLAYHPDKRLTPWEALQHPFMAPEICIPFFLSETAPDMNVIRKSDYNYRQNISTNVQRLCPSTFDLLRVGTSDQHLFERSNIALVEPLGLETETDMEKAQRRCDDHRRKPEVHDRNTVEKQWVPRGDTTRHMRPKDNNRSGTLSLSKSVEALQHEKSSTTVSMQTKQAMDILSVGMIRHKSPLCKQESINCTNEMSSESHQYHIEEQRKISETALPVGKTADHMANPSSSSVSNITHVAKKWVTHLSKDLSNISSDILSIKQGETQLKSEPRSLNSSWSEMPHVKPSDVADDQVPCLEAQEILNASSATYLVEKPKGKKYLADHRVLRWNGTTTHKPLERENVIHPVCRSQEEVSKEQRCRSGHETVTQNQSSEIIAHDHFEEFSEMNDSRMMETLMPQRRSSQSEKVSKSSLLSLQEKEIGRLRHSSTRKHTSTHQSGQDQQNASYTVISITSVSPSDSKECLLSGTKDWSAKKESIIHTENEHVQRQGDNIRVACHHCSPAHENSTCKLHLNVKSKSMKCMNELSEKLTSNTCEESCQSSHNDCLFKDNAPGERITLCSPESSENYDELSLASEDEGSDSNSGRPGSSALNATFILEHPSIELEPLKEDTIDRIVKTEHCVSGSKNSKIFTAPHKRIGSHVAQDSPPLFLSQVSNSNTEKAFKGVAYSRSSTCSDSQIMWSAGTTFCDVENQFKDTQTARSGAQDEETLSLGSTSDVSDHSKEQSETVFHIVLDHQDKKTDHIMSSSEECNKANAKGREEVASVLTNDKASMLMNVFVESCNMLNEQAGNTRDTRPRSESSRLDPLQTAQDTSEIEERELIQPKPAVSDDRKVTKQKNRKKTGRKSQQKKSQKVNSDVTPHSRDNCYEQDGTEVEASESYSTSSRPRACSRKFVSYTMRRVSTLYTDKFNYEKSPVVTGDYKYHVNPQSCDIGKEGKGTSANKLQEKFCHTEDKNVKSREEQKQKAKASQRKSGQRRKTKDSKSKQGSRSVRKVNNKSDSGKNSRGSETLITLCDEQFTSHPNTSRFDKGGNKVKKRQCSSVSTKQLGQSTLNKESGTSSEVESHDPVTEQKVLDESEMSSADHFSSPLIISSAKATPSLAERHGTLSSDTKPVIGGKFSLCISGQNVHQNLQRGQPALTEPDMCKGRPRTRDGKPLSAKRLARAKSVKRALSFQSVKTPTKGSKIIVQETLSSKGTPPHNPLYSKDMAFVSRNSMAAAVADNSPKCRSSTNNERVRKRLIDYLSMSQHSDADPYEFKATPAKLRQSLLAVKPTSTSVKEKRPRTSAKTTCRSSQGKKRASQMLSQNSFPITVGISGLVEMKSKQMMMDVNTALSQDRKLPGNSTVVVDQHMMQGRLDDQNSQHVGTSRTEGATKSDIVWDFELSEREEKQTEKTIYHSTPRRNKVSRAEHNKKCLGEIQRALNLDMSVSPVGNTEWRSSVSQSHISRKQVATDDYNFEEPNTDPRISEKNAVRVDEIELPGCGRNKISSALSATTNTDLLEIHKLPLPCCSVVCTDIREQSRAQRLSGSITATLPQSSSRLVSSRKRKLEQCEEEAVHNKNLQLTEDINISQKSECHNDNLHGVRRHLQQFAQDKLTSSSDLGHMDGKPSSQRHRIMTMVSVKSQQNNVSQDKVADESCLDEEILLLD